MDLAEALEEAAEGVVVDVVGEVSDVELHFVPGILSSVRAEASRVAKSARIRADGELVSVHATGSDRENGP
jgi:hypothetical protein